MAGVQPEKLHAACDECRTRKLKCSGDSPACSRCEREKIRCVYSPQKPMGRPRKRRREETPMEDTQEGAVDPSPTVNGFSMHNFGDEGLRPQTDLTPTVDFPGFGGVSLDDAFAEAMIPPSYAEAFGQVPAYDPSHSHSVHPIDPLLWEQQPSDSDFQSQANSTPGQPDTGPCTCLSLMYLALSDLQSINNFSFPAVVPRIRATLNTASVMVHCIKCPTEMFSAIQNMQSLNSLLGAIAERFHKVLAEIDAEADRLEQSGMKKPFRVGDNSPENMHLHTGSTDCPMGYDIDLDPRDWRKLAKQMLKTEVMGGGHNPTSLVRLLEEVEERQHKWHFDKSMHAEERTRLFGAENMCKEGEGAICLRMVGQLRNMVNQMKWD
ncbi:hypothetical protein BU23DRAFT_87051 [Bimuria novae-zelandiae CBS 107.79]|uniref:Zn(2)-C6 fungal-type domain-containing protein n=1 Tax=Bimuria novae-zelandiae CBS 107.79 TaxID=1447943 RepID=A0A6A5VFA3_9PLEO|nr:hypothetical protein BU23DRAFT_87051 [Bimuria novae-zelandiae CBS 107.79]